MASTTTDLPVSTAGSKSRAGSDALEAEAIGLDVAVRIHGSQVAAVVLESTEHVEPFEEDTTTMIVFPRGAVVKLRARVRTGHAVVLTNLLTKQTALCRIIQVNTAPNVAHYVKLEFVQPTPEFWGVHFPSDPLPSARPQKASVPAPAPAPHVAPTPAMPVAHVASTKSQAETQPTTTKPLVRETSKSTLPRDLPLAVPSTEYGSTRNSQQEDILPLASSSPVAEKRTANQLRTPVAAPKPAPKAEIPSAAAALGQPIFDSLTTQEEVFSGKVPAPFTEAAHHADSAIPRKPLSGINYSSFLQSAAPLKRRSSAWIFAGAAAVLVGLAAGGAMYLRHNDARAAQTPSLSRTSAAPPQSTQPTAGVSAPVATSSVATSTPAPMPAQGQPRAVAGAPATTDARNSRAAIPTHAPKKSGVSTSHPIISTGVADIYAGDLVARPHVAPHARGRVAAPLPNINARASREVPGTAGGNALGALVTGSVHASLVAPPPAPKSAPRQGGDVVLPRLISSVAPVYPSLAAANHVEGDVKIQAEIDTRGRVTATKVISGPILLRGAAINAVRQWKYSPATLDGKPTVARYSVTVRFHLNQ